MAFCRLLAASAPSSIIMALFASGFGGGKHTFVL